MSDVLVNFTGQYRRKILWDASEAIPEPEVLVEVKTSHVIPPPAKPKIGNGHKSVKVRNLTDHERNTIRAVFIAEDGVAEDDRWVLLHKDMDPVIGIFQVTGFVSYLHREVAMGKITLKDMPRYVKYMKKRRNLWATYNSPKYVAMRNALKQVPKSINGEGQLTPKFASGFPPRGLKKWSS